MARHSSDTFDADDELLDGAASSSGVKGGGYATFLFLVGFAILGAGAALTAAPYFSWTVEQIGRRVAAHGVGNGAILACGFAFVALGFVARAAVKAATTASHGTDTADLEGIVTADSARLRASLAGLTEELRGVNRAQTDLFQRLEHIAQASAETERTPGDENQNALFRLAASMDKLSAQLDQRIHGLDEQIRSRIEDVSRTIQETRTTLEHRMQAVATTAAAAPRAAVPATAARPQASTTAAGARRREELEVAVDLDEPLFEPEEPNLEFFDTVQDLDSMVRSRPGTGGGGELGQGGRPQAGAGAAAAARPERRRPPEDEVPEALDLILPDDEEG